MGFRSLIFCTSVLAAAAAQPCQKSNCEAEVAEDVALLQTHQAASSLGGADHVTCTHSETMCSGNQCCPRAENTNNKTYPCPSADEGWDQCETQYEPRAAPSTESDNSRFKSFFNLPPPTTCETTADCEGDNPDGDFFKYVCSFGDSPSDVNPCFTCSQGTGVTGGQVLRCVQNQCGCGQIDYDTNPSSSCDSLMDQETCNQAGKTCIAGNLPQPVCQDAGEPNSVCNSTAALYNGYAVIDCAKCPAKTSSFGDSPGTTCFSYGIPTQYKCGCAGSFDGR